MRAEDAAAVDGHVDASDVARVVIGQKDDGAGDFIG